MFGYLHPLGRGLQGSGGPWGSVGHVEESCPALAGQGEEGQERACKRQV